MNQYRIFQPHEVTYDLYLTDNVVRHCAGRVPNRFHRWTLRLMFGLRIVPRQEKSL